LLLSGGDYRNPVNSVFRNSLRFTFSAVYSFFPVTLQLENTKAARQYERSMPLSRTRFEPILNGPSGEIRRCVGSINPGQCQAAQLQIIFPQLSFSQSHRMAISIATILILQSSEKLDAQFITSFAVSLNPAYPALRR
jgi:hypothetical protein